MEEKQTENKPLEKPWAVYDVPRGAVGIGLLKEKLPNGTSYLTRFEHQYPPESWDTRYIHTFNKLSEAVDYFLKNQCPVYGEDPYSKEKTFKILSINFRIAMKQEKQKEIKSLVTLLKNVALSQSSPKCTENTKSQFGPCVGCIRQEKAC